jgi:hypothetical protein
MLERGKKLASARRKTSAGKSARKAIGELGGESQHVVVERLAPCAAAKLDP